MKTQITVTLERRLISLISIPFVASENEFDHIILLQYNRSFNKIIDRSQCGVVTFPKFVADYDKNYV